MKRIAAIITAGLLLPGCATDAQQPQAESPSLAVETIPAAEATQAQSTQWRVDYFGAVIDFNPIPVPAPNDLAKKFEKWADGTELDMGQKWVVLHVDNTNGEKRIAPKTITIISDDETMAMGVMDTVTYGVSEISNEDMDTDTYNEGVEIYSGFIESIEPGDKGEITMPVMGEVTTPTTVTFEFEYMTETEAYPMP